MNIKSVINLLIAFCFVLAGVSCAHLAKNDVSLHQSCEQCGMDRGKFDFSRMVIDYEEGTSAAVCSLRCAAQDMADNVDKTPKSIKVADLNSRLLIDGVKAFWVVGGSKRGVMSRQGKWAFENKNDAENFMKTNQGRMVSFEEALEITYDEMPSVTKELREKIMMKIAKMMEQKK